METRRVAGQMLVRRLEHTRRSRVLNSYAGPEGSDEAT